MNELLFFFVPGLAKTSGSKRAFHRPGMRFPVIVEDCKGSKDWRGDCKRFALEAIAAQTLATSPQYPLEGPLMLSLQFTMVRPKNHFRSNGALKPDAPVWHQKKPDALKMARAIEDALTGILWRDDSQIASESIVKIYGPQPGCHVWLSRPTAVPSAMNGERPEQRRLFA